MLDIYHFRNKEKEEVDFVIQLRSGAGPTWLAIEAKFASQSATGVRLPKSLSKTQQNRRKWAVIFKGERRRLSNDVLQLPISQLATEVESLVATSESES